MIDKLRAVEDAYLELFCRKESSDGSDFFWNDFAQGLYDQNIILIKELPHERDLKNWLTSLSSNFGAPNDGESLAKFGLSVGCNQEKRFYKIVFHPKIELAPEFLEWVTQMGFTSSNIIYMHKPLKPDGNWAPPANCVIKRADTGAEIREGLDCAAKSSGERMSAALLAQKLAQKERLYLVKSILFYVCYVDGVPIGYCDWFQKDGIVKIEELAILPEYQRKGFGGAMLGKTISAAGEQGFDLIYLVTHEEDEAKNLYRKMGFEVIGKETELYYELAPDQ